jgi:bifunctional enzyme CysN/CysC
MPKEIFKITSAGSVDDGKSTILARLLLDTGSIYDDQISKNFDPNRIADLLDGLESEREQGITIDVAHRFFDSSARRYQIADSPGHEQYTRNMATACAGSDALMLVVDAPAGLKPQTRLHLEIALRLGIRDIIFVVNKIDLVSFSKKVFDKNNSDISDLIKAREQLFPGIKHLVIPVSGLKGHNVVKRSSKLSWFSGPTLLHALDALERKSRSDDDETLIAVQYVQRLAGGGRRYLGSVRSGRVSKGRALFANGQEVRVKELFAAGTICEVAKPGSAISIALDSEIDLEPGDLVSSDSLRPHDQFEVDLIWLSEEKGIKGRKYQVRAGSAETSVSITKVSQLDLETNQKAGELSSIGINEIQRCNLSLSRPVYLSPFLENKETGRLVLIDPHSGDSVAVGTVNFALRRSENITRQDFKVTPDMHAERMGTQPKVIWFTGLSGSGKSTVANALSAELHDRGIPHFVLDGDNLRFGINRDLGFTEEDRTENIRRTAEVAALMANAGLFVAVALVSPSERDREMARQIIGVDRFRLIYVNTPFEECEKRDPKGLYAKARAGHIPNFPGLTSKFDEPEWADLKLEHLSVRDATRLVQELINYDSVRIIKS